MLQALTMEQIRQIALAAERLSTQVSTSVANADPKVSMTLRVHLYSLSAEAIVELKALLWMGMGDCADFDSAVSRARTQDNPIQDVSDQASIPKYLRKGAAMLGLQLG